MIIFMRTTEIWSPTNGITHITGSAFRYNHLNLPTNLHAIDKNGPRDGKEKLKGEYDRERPYIKFVPKDFYRNQEK